MEKRKSIVTSDVIGRVLAMQVLPVLRQLKVVEGYLRGVNVFLHGYRGMEEFEPFLSHGERGSHYGKYSVVELVGVRPRVVIFCRSFPTGQDEVPFYSENEVTVQVREGKALVLHSLQMKWDPVIPPHFFGATISEFQNAAETVYGTLRG